MQRLRDIPASPFKFLDPYGREDRDIFFGRGEEVETLYQYVNKNRLVLVYGPSGAGKTSLVQCGLGNRFEATDWAPFFIRRGKDINTTLRQAIQQSKALGGGPIEDDAQLLHALERISARYLRPVYLIFDQFEELLILGEEEEQAQFLDTLEALLESPQAQSCNLLFILREEYFARLEAFERRFAGFSDRRLRVEPMRPARIEPVIIRSCAHFRVSLEDPQANARQIIDNLSGRSGISLPYLQVYLDMLWREDYARTYPDAIVENWGEAFPPLEFTTEEIAEFGAIQDVLERFLQERRDEIQQQLANDHPGIAPGAVRAVLDTFATDEGTKRPLSYTLEYGQVILSETAPHELRSLHAPQLTDCLRALEQSRLLRSDGHTFELAHDTLAQLIDQQRSAEQRQLRDIRQRIKTGYKEHLDSGGAYFFNQGQLARIEPFLPQLTLEPEQAAFIEESRAEAQRQARAEQERVERELRLAEDKLVVEERARRRQAFFSRLIAAVAVVAAVIAVAAIWFFLDARQAKDIAEAATRSANEKLIEALRQKEKRLKLEITQAERAQRTYDKIKDTLLLQETDAELRQLDSLRRSVQGDIEEAERQTVDGGR